MSYNTVKRLRNRLTAYKKEELGLKKMKMYVFDNGVQVVDKAIMLSGYGIATTENPNPPSTVIRIPMQTFLFEHEDGYVLFDTACDPDWEKNWPEQIKLQSPYEYPENGLLPDRLAQLGLTPMDIKYVVMSHLHVDHAGCLYMFKNAQVFVNDHELTNSVRNYVTGEPMDVHLPSDIEHFIQAKLNWRPVLDDEFELPLLDGLTIVNLGSGHSWGMLALRVDLENSGTFLLVADSLYSSENAGPPVHMPGIVYDTLGYLQVARKIQKYAEKYNCKILYGHDIEQFATLVKSTEGFYD